VTFNSSSRRPPRLVVRTLVATSAAIGLVLVAVFVVLSMDARNRIAGTTAENLDTAQRAFADLEQRRQQEVLIRLNAMAASRRPSGGAMPARATRGRFRMAAPVSEYSACRVASLRLRTGW